MRFVRWRALCGAVAAVALLTTPAQADIRALLVGVSDYPDDLAVADLKGPANDVRLMRDTLRARGAVDVDVLADGVTGSDVPTLAAIRSGLGGMAERAGPGDLVVVYFSGHGTRQPDTYGDEVDGYDEVFLPADVGRTAPGERGIPNGLVDDEIGRAVTAIRATGADVWLVMDSCHSGTGVRAAASGVRARYVDPGAFGLEAAPADVMAEPSPAFSDAMLPDGAGRLIAFYAAQASELAYEIDFSAPAAAGEPQDDAGWHGLFTSRLAARLQTVGAISYRQLFQAVLADMNDRRGNGGTMQTPFWEGDLDAAQVFGGSATVGVKQFAIDGRTLAAGLVHGIREGDVLAAVADAADPADAAAGYVRVESAMPLSATLAPVNAACASGGDDCAAADGGFLASARYARLAAPALDLTLRLGAPVDLDRNAAPVQRGGDRRTDELLDALDALRDLPGGALGGTVSFDARSADILVGVSDGRLWFGPEVLVAGEPAGASWTPEEGTEALAALISRMVKAQRLLELAASVEATRLFALPSPITVGAHLAAADPALLAPDRDPRHECAAVATKGGYAKARPLTPGDALKQCDRLAFTTSSSGGAAYDVNMIYLDANHELAIKYERIEGVGQEWPFMALTACSECPGGTRSVGVETALFVVTRATANADQLNLEPLATVEAGSTRGAPLGASPFGRFLAEAMDASATGTRGGFSAAVPDDVWVETLRWRIVPRSAAARIAADD